MEYTQGSRLPQYILDELDQQTLIAAAAALTKNIMAAACEPSCNCDREQRLQAEARRMTLEIDLNALVNITFHRAKFSLGNQESSTTHEEG
jgi:hypothetical protein